MKKYHLERLFRNEGFTLIEIMVVIVILGILATYTATKVIEYIDEAKQTRAKMDIYALKTALQLYKGHMNSYPTTEQGLQALVTPPAGENVSNKWKKGGYLENGIVPKDPWGNNYIYLSPGVNSDFDIISYGADGIQGGEGFNMDINNWDQNG
jgi:general secretion pathway protein G